MESLSKQEATTGEFKEPLPKKTAAAPTTVDVKECPFNPFGNDECDMCGSWKNLFFLSSWLLHI